MNDNDLICKSLDKNFSVCTQNSYLAVHEHNTEKRIELNSFTGEFKHIFGDFITDAGEPSISIFNRWFERQRAALLKGLDEYKSKIDGSVSLTDLITKGINDLVTDNITEDYIKNEIKSHYYKLIVVSRTDEYLDKVDRSIGINDLIAGFNQTFSDELPYYNSVLTEKPKTYYYNNLLNGRLNEYLNNIDYSLDSTFLITAFLNNFSDELPYFKSSMTLKFNDVYCAKVVMPILDEYIQSIQSNIDSGTLIDNLTLKLELNGKFYSEYAINYVNKWYSNTVVGVKMQDLLSQLVITPIHNDWRVTWVGHGKVTRETILSKFKNENGYQHTFLTGMYDEWYAEEIVNASERLAKSTASARLPRIVDNQQNILNILND